MEKLDFSKIHTDNAQALNDAYKAKLKGKNVAPVKSTAEKVHEAAFAEPEKKSRKSAVPQAASQFSEREMKTFASVLNREKKPEDPEIQKKRIAKEKALKIRKIADYKSREVFGDAFDHIKVPPFSASMEVVDATLDEIHEICASRGAENQIRALPGFAAYGLEYVTMKMGYNPMSWNLTNFGAQFSDPRTQAKMEPELTELVVEYKHHLCSPVYLRFMSTMFQLASVYSDRNPAGAPPSDQARQMGMDL